MLRSNIPVRKDATLQRARLYMTARGVYDVHVNGARITDNLLAPGLTQYDKRMNYQTYDLTGILKPGNNGIGVALGSGWWCDAQTFVVKNYNYFGGIIKVLEGLPNLLRGFREGFTIKTSIVVEGSS